MSRKRYTRHRSSGVEWLGEIPEHWEMKRTRFKVRLNPSKQEISMFPKDQEVFFLPMEAVGDNGSLNLEQTRNVADVETGYTYFSEGDLTYAKITPCFENGKGAIMRGLLCGFGFGSTELTVIRPKNDVLKDYLYYLTISNEFRKNGEAWMYGAGGQKRVPDDFVKEFRFAWPPIDEQQAISAFLDRETSRIDELLAKKQRQIELLQEKRSALISHIVTKGLDPTVNIKDSGVEWLGKIPEHWKILQLRRVVDKFIDYRGRTPVKTDNGVPLITAGAVKDGMINHSIAPEYIAEEDYAEWMNRGLPEAGDVVLTTEAPLAEVAQVRDTNVAFAQRIIVFKVNRDYVCPEFLRYYYLSSVGRSELLSRASGSTASGIRSDRLKMSLVIVPTVREQLGIANHLDQHIMKLVLPIVHIRTSIDLLREYRTALISAAVTGKIDVREEVA